MKILVTTIGDKVMIRVGDTITMMIPYEAVLLAEELTLASAQADLCCEREEE